jgi:hypothetical protein
MISCVCQYKAVWLKFTSNKLELSRRQHGRPTACVIALHYFSATPSTALYFRTGTLGVLVKNHLICFKKFGSLKLLNFKILILGGRGVCIENMLCL